MDAPPLRRRNDPLEHPSPKTRPIPTASPRKPFGRPSGKQLPCLCLSGQMHPGDNIARPALELRRRSGPSHRRPAGLGAEGLDGDAPPRTAALGAEVRLINPRPRVSAGARTHQTEQGAQRRDLGWRSPGRGPMGPRERSARVGMSTHWSLGLGPDSTKLGENSADFGPNTAKLGMCSTEFGGSRAGVEVMWGELGRVWAKFGPRPNSAESGQSWSNIGKDWLVFDQI